MIIKSTRAGIKKTNNETTKSDDDEEKGRRKGDLDDEICKVCDYDCNFFERWYHQLNLVLGKH